MRWPGLALAVLLAAPGIAAAQDRATPYPWEQAWFDRWRITPAEAQTAAGRGAERDALLRRFRVAQRFRELAAAGRQGDQVARMLVAGELNRRCNGGRRLSYAGCAAWLGWIDRYGIPGKPHSDPVWSLRPSDLRRYGDSGRMFEIGEMFERGDGGPVDYALALRAYGWATSVGATPAQGAEASYRLGLMAEKGLGRPANRAAAYSYYRTAAFNGHAMANYLMAFEDLRTDPGAVSSAALRFRDAGDAGVADGAYRYALLLYEGKVGVSQRKDGRSPSAAQACFAYFRKAALAGHVRAMTMLGRLYREGLGVPADAARAEEWWKRAGRAGDAEASWLVSGLHARRNDFPGGLPWLKRAAAGNYPGAQPLLRQWTANGVRERSLFGDLLSVVTYLGDGAAAYEQQRKAQIDYELSQWLAAKYAGGGGSSSAAADDLAALDAGPDDSGAGGSLAQGTITVAEDESYKRWQAAEAKRQVEAAADRERRAADLRRFQAEDAANRAAADAEAERRRTAHLISCYGSVEAARNAHTSCQ